MNAFDLVADRFERHRPVPSRVPVAVRDTLRQCAGIGPSGRILEIGCGAGGIGSHFAVSGDPYVGLDLSEQMLLAFQQKAAAPSFALVRADGHRLPFADRTFAAVLMVHVTMRDWRALFAEALRVLDAGGVLAIGRVERPAAGVDARMRERLNELIAAASTHRRSPGRQTGMDWLGGQCSRQMEIVVAEWPVERTPRDFIVRKQSAAGFMSLAPALRESALQSLSAWAEQNIGPVDAPFVERHSFSLRFYWFEATARHE